MTSQEKKQISICLKFYVTSVKTSKYSKYKDPSFNISVIK